MSIWICLNVNIRTSIYVSILVDILDRKIYTTHWLIDSWVTTPLESHWIGVPYIHSSEFIWVHPQKNTFLSSKCYKNKSKQHIVTYTVLHVAELFAYNTMNMFLKWQFQITEILSLITFNGRKESLRNENLRRIHSFDNFWGYRLQWTRPTEKPCERHWAEEGSNLTPLDEHRVIHHQHPKLRGKCDLGSTTVWRIFLADRKTTRYSSLIVFAWSFIRFHPSLFTACLASTWQIHRFLSDPLRTCQPTNPLKHLWTSEPSFQKRRRKTPKSSTELL